MENVQNFSLGKKISFHRHRLGMKQQELADILDIEQSKLSDFENDKRQPHYIELVRLAETFKISLSELEPPCTNIFQNNTLYDNSANIMNQYQNNINDVKELYRGLLEAKDEVIKVKNEAIKTLEQLLYQQKK
jgi:transcriptional regulator with XRE-family HTH domain